MAFDKKDIVNKTYTNTKGSKFKVVKYWGRDAKKRHNYIIEFPKTGNKYKADRAKIRRKTPKDEALRKIKKKVKQTKKYNKNKKKYGKKKDMKKIFTGKDLRKYKILAVDQATIKTGFSIIQGSKLLDHGVLIENGKDINHRINNMCKRITKLAKENDVDGLVIEDIYLGNAGVLTFKKLAWIQGNIMNIGVELDLDYLLIKASEWKAYWGIMGGHSIEQKAKGKKLVRNKFGIKPKTDDESDVILMGAYAVRERIKSNQSWE